MPGIFSTQQVTILPPTRQSAGTTGLFSNQLTAITQNTAQQQLGMLIGQGVKSVQNQIDTIMQALRSPLPFPNAIGITDSTGNLIAWIGQPPSSNPTLQPAWFQGLDMAGSITSPVWRFQPAGNVVADDGNANIIFQLGSGPEIQIASDSATNIATLQPNLFQLVIGGAQVAIIESTSWFNQFAALGTSVSPLVTLGMVGVTSTLTLNDGLGNSGVLNDFSLAFNGTGGAATLSGSGGLQINTSGSVATLSPSLLIVQGLPTTATPFQHGYLYADPGDSYRVKWIP